MREALSLTMDGLVRALAGFAERPAVDRAVADKAEALARERGPDARVEKRGPGDYAVTISGPNLAARTDVAEEIARATGKGSTP